MDLPTEGILADEPLRIRRQGEPWLDFLLEQYQHTLAELAMPLAAWEAHFKQPHPGPRYTEALEAQKRRLAKAIEAGGPGPNARRSEARRAVLSAVFTTALEGGIGYWCRIKSYRWARSGAGEDYTGDIDGFRAVIEEDEDGENPGREHVIDADVIARGINRLASMEATFGGKPLNGNGHLYKLACALNGPGAGDVDFDADDADNIVQAGLFNDIVYG